MDVWNRPIADISFCVDYSRMFVRTSALFFLLIAPAAAGAEVPLDGLISFDDPYRCLAAKDFDKLLNSVIRWQKSGDTYRGRLAPPAVPTRFRRQVGTPKLTVKEDEYRATVPLKGTWQQLPVHSLVKVQWVESEGGFYLVFDATPEQVRQAANTIGFQIPASGSEYRNVDVLGVNVGVETFEDKAALYCIDG